MREVIWVAAIVMVGLLLYRGLNVTANVEPPDDQWFAATVIDESQQRPVLVTFGAEWCGYCKKMEPDLEQLHAKLGDKLHIVHVDVDERGELARHYGVSGIPHSFLFNEGKLVADQSGYMQLPALEKWTSSWVNN
ncbi:MAG: thioredoxin family protein [Planctomycetaceae bacterium]